MAVRRRSRATAARSIASGRSSRRSSTGQLLRDGPQVYGRSVVTGLARLDGWPVAVMASDPMFYGGGWTADACQKVDALRRPRRDLPSAGRATSVDCPGFLIGLEAEKSGDDPPGRARAWRRCTRPPCRGAASSSARPSASPARRTRTRARLQLPLRLAVGRLGLAAARGRHRGRLPRRDRRAPTIPRPRWREIEERLNQLRSPFRTAETFWIEEIIDPRDTRQLLCEFANLAAPLREAGPVATAMRP